MRQVLLGYPGFAAAGCGPAPGLALVAMAGRASRAIIPVACEVYAQP
jgi:hypothetical protein